MARWQSELEFNRIIVVSPDRSILPLKLRLLDHQRLMSQGWEVNILLKPNLLLSFISLTNERKTLLFLIRGMKGITITEAKNLGTILNSSFSISLIPPVRKFISFTFLHISLLSPPLHPHTNHCLRTDFTFTYSNCRDNIQLAFPTYPFTTFLLEKSFKNHVIFSGSTCLR